MGRVEVLLFVVDLLWDLLLLAVVTTFPAVQKVTLASLPMTKDRSIIRTMMLSSYMAYFITVWTWCNL